MSDTEFAALLCSRLCHDLVSSVGAVTNGLEILQDEKNSDMREQVFDLLRVSSEQTNTKLLFFRLSFGSAGGLSSKIDLGEARRALDGFVTMQKLALDWKLSDGQAPMTFVKPLLNLALLGTECLLRGGVIGVSAKTEGEDEGFEITATGPRVQLLTAVRAALEGTLPDSDHEPRLAPALLVGHLAKRMNARVTIEESEDGVAFRYVCCDFEMAAGNA